MRKIQQDRRSLLQILKYGFTRFSFETFLHLILKISGRLGVTFLHVHHRVHHQVLEPSWSTLIQFIRGHATDEVTGEIHEFPHLAGVGSRSLRENSHNTPLPEIDGVRYTCDRFTPLSDKLNNLV